MGRKAKAANCQSRQLPKIYYKIGLKRLSNKR